MNAAAPSPPLAPSERADLITKDMVRWLERAVIGLNLCPFAKGVHAKGQIHYVVSAATGAEALAQDLRRELAGLAATPAQVRDTTMLMAPDCLQDFLEFNDFLGVAEDVLEELDLDGTLQIASFHPEFQFAGTDAGDVTNCTNRAPYPTLHLLREDSIDRAVQAYPEAEAIYQRNMEVLEKLGMPGWQAMDVGVSTAASTPELPKDPA
ncbi:MAG: DUF1415 domain-containing protein [Gammaproteobacteria bacterium]|nr:DUF1415 domain-containing protein [Gammaproteobacteria bacterium]